MRLGQVDISDATTGDVPDALRVSGNWGAAAEPEALEGAVAEDPLLARIAALRSPAAAVARRGLRDGELEPALVPHANTLLSRDEVARDTVLALRRVAMRATGQLVDALLDGDRLRAVRRRLPRVVKGCA